MADELAEAMNRLADTMGQVRDGQREAVAEVRAVRGIAQRILDAITDPEGESPVATALRELAETVGRLDQTQGALVPDLRDLVQTIRSRMNRNGG